MKKWEERREKLLHSLAQNGKLSMKQIEMLLGISESTARRLVTELSEDHCLIRCFGGIQKIQPFAKEYSYAETEVEHAPLKEEIGSCAAGLVHDGDVIYLSGGSTVKYMAAALSSHIREKRLNHISVITNSLVASEVLSDCTNVIMPGGVYRRSLQVLDGSLTEKNLRSMCFTKAFLGVVALNESEGFMTADIETNSIIEVVLTKASSYYVLADSTKFGRHSFISYGRLKDAAGIVTDRCLSSSLRESLTGQGINIITF